MNFDYNEEQQLLADSVRRFLQKDYDFEARRKIVASPEGWSARVWSQLAEMGLTGLPFSPDYGGFGGGAVDLMGVMEAFGEALVVEPYLATIMGAQLVARAGSAEQKRAILPAVVGVALTSNYLAGIVLGSDFRETAAVRCCRSGRARCSAGARWLSGFRCPTVRPSTG